MEPVVAIAIIGALGIGAQWLAWRLRLPAIVLMLAAGVLAGPVTGLVDPADVFGDLLRPLIALAVAIILFEGGITLRIEALREASKSVRRLVVLGAPLGWITATLAARYGAGLSWEAATIFGGILIVTGPTVVTPLLRQARLGHKVSEILRWEAIVNDPVGALAAVLAFEVVHLLHVSGSVAEAVGHLVLGITVAGAAGFAAGWLVVRGFRRGYVPEYLKVPVLLGTVVATYVGSDLLLHESGLLAVTVMGAVIGNSTLPSLAELRRFKENVTVLLVSGVFILLAADLSWDMLGLLDWRALAFVGLIVFVARPLSVFLALSGTELTRSEKTIVAWVGPRGVVAVAVSGLFGARLSDIGLTDGALLAPLAFVLVAVTVVLHGFSLAPVARLLGLTSKEPPGVILVGGSSWTSDLGEALQEAGVPVVIADRNWFRLREARERGLPVYFGEFLSEATEHRLEMNRYGMIWALSDNDDYNTLVCTNYAPEFGRNNVFQIGRNESSALARALPETIGGRRIGTGLSFEEFQRRSMKSWEFVATPLTEEFGPEDHFAEHPKAERIAVIRSNGTVVVFKADFEPKMQAGDSILAMAKIELPVEKNEEA